MTDPTFDIENPVTGQRMTFLNDPDDPARDPLAVEYWRRPGGGPLPEHVHPYQEERFEVVSGRFGVRVGGETQVLEPGDRFTGPARVPHTHWNEDDDEPVRVDIEFSPALGARRAFEDLFALGGMDELADDGSPSFWQAMVLLEAHDDVLYPAEPAVPVPVQRAVVKGLAPIGRALGYRPRYPEGTR